MGMFLHFGLGIESAQRGEPCSYLGSGFRDLRNGANGGLAVYTRGEN